MSPALPVYHRATHHSGGVTTAGSHYSPGRFGARRGRIAIMIQITVVICVLLPLLFLLYDTSGLRSRHHASGGWSNRKALMNKQAYPAAHLLNLVLVAGHAVYTGLDFSLATQESSWFLESYQKVSGEAQSFVDHIRLGVQEAAEDPTALLLFSGGQTRQEAGPRSEGLSYWIVAEAAKWFGTEDVRKRTFTEEHARDSFENLLFSLCRFFELTGHYPEQITVVSYNLKQNRFSTLHRGAIRFPSEKFKFVGTPVPPEASGAEEGEARTVAAFKNDPYGCSTNELLQKRLRRDPFAVGPIHPSRCPDMRELLLHCSPTIYGGSLPWISGKD